MKYGILVDDSVLDGWIERCLARLSDVPGTELALWILADIDPSAQFSPSFSAETLRTRTELKGNTRAVDCKTDAAIAEANLDFLLILSRDVIRGEFVSALRLGAWAFSFGNAAGAADVAFSAIFDAQRTIDGRLVRLCTDPQREITLRRGVFRVNMASVSKTARELNRVTSHWAAQVCIDLLDGLGAYVDGPSAAPAPDRPATRRISSLRFRLRYAVRFAAKVRHHVGRSVDWNIGIVRSTPLEVTRSGRLPPAEWLAPRPGTFFADPFPFARNGQRYILFEEFDNGANRGVISLTELDEYGHWSAPKPVIVAPHHLSYPFLIEDGGRVYCVPESCQARQVSLYVADPFPTTWRHEGVLVSGIAAVDNTVVRHDGRWWLFCTNYDEGDCVSLWLFHAPHLRGPWRPHNNNPVKTDVTSSRPAGPLFRDGTVLYRPAQDCSERYGGRLVINRVTTLSPREFHEEAVSVIGPNPTGRYPSGLHTLAGCDDWSVIDGKRVSYSSAKMWAEALDYAARARRRLVSLMRGEVAIDSGGMRT